VLPEFGLLGHKIFSGRYLKTELLLFIFFVLKYLGIDLQVDDNAEVIKTPFSCIRFRVISSELCTILVKTLRRVISLHRAPNQVRTATCTSII
jgi:hypothetical protein